MATLGLDTSAYEQGIEESKAQTKTAVASMTKDYNKLYSDVLHLTAAYQKSSKETGENSRQTKELKAKLREAQTQLNATAQGLKTAEQYMGSFGKKAEGAGESLAGAMTKASLLSGVISKLSSAVLNTGKDFIQSGIEYNAQIETYRTGLTNMLGDAEAANAALEQMQQDAARTPFSVDALVSANQYLISAGENATYARKTIMALGDAVSATGGGSDELNRMAQNLQQIANTGKATSADIKQFAYAGIDVYGILADYTGKSTAEVQNMTISYDLLTQALQAAAEEGGRYYNSMDTQSQTMNGRVSTLKDNVKQLAGLMTEDLSGGIGLVIGNINDMVVAAQEAYKQDGWLGLAGAITGLTGPIDSVKQKFNELGSAAVTALDKASYYLNKALGKDAYAGYSGYEDYRADEDAKAAAATSRENRDRRRQEALSGKGIYTESWTERQSKNNGGSSISNSGSSAGSSGKNTVTKTVLSSMTDAATSYSANEFGQITTAVTELTEHIKDSTGKVYDQLTKTTTESGKEMVNGVIKNYKLVTKAVTDENGKVTTTTQKTYEDASKSIAATIVKTAESVKDGVSQTIETTTEKYQDGSEHIKQIVTETGERIVNGAVETYTKVRTLTDGFETDSKETVNASVSQYDTLLSSYTDAADKVQQLTALYNESAAGTGEFSDQTMRLSALLAEAEQKLSDSKTAWEEYQKTTNRAYVVTKNFADFVKSSNSAVSSFGSSIKDLGEFFDNEAVENVGDFFTEISDGVDKVINFATSVSTLVTTLQQLKTAIQAVNATGGISSAFSGIGSLLGIGGSTAAGAGVAAAGTGAAAAAGTTGAAAAGGTGLSALGFAVPELGAIIAGVLGVAAIGYGIYKWATKDSGQKKEESKNEKLSYKDIQDAYWYGNERAFAGYDYRVDPYTFQGMQTSTLEDYQSKIQAQLEVIGAVVQQYLPQAGNQVIKLDDGTLVGALAPSIDAQLGHLATLAERGN